MLLSMKRLFTALALGSALVLSACGGGSDGDDNGPSSQGCNAPNDLTRSTDTPIGMLLPSGSFERQSYTSAAEVAAAGLNAVSFGLSFYYTSTGELVYDFDGSSDDAAKERWTNTIACAVIEAKESGLVVAVWGQFIEAGSRGEPGQMPTDIQTPVLESTVDLMPEVAELLDELQVEYWAPISELERFTGIENHNTYFPQMVAASRPLFNGIIYAQPNILQRDGFVVQDVEPNLGGADALGISWISYECDEQKLPPGQSLESSNFYIDAAAAQGITKVFISEVGGTQNTDESARPCLEKLIEYWDGATTGVFVLDMPSDQPGGASVKGNWQEAVLQSLRN
jgi:hypothetical protein